MKKKKSKTFQISPKKKRKKNIKINQKLNKNVAQRKTVESGNVKRQPPVRKSQNKVCKRARKKESKNHSCLAYIRWCITWLAQSILSAKTDLSRAGNLIGRKWPISKLVLSRLANECLSYDFFVCMFDCHDNYNKEEYISSCRGDWKMWKIPQIPPRD